ncbi:MAG: hypothetical protein RIQ89_1301 [Bacteroidota bacterium]|jgi:FkbM family methyltransferase
MLSRLIIEAKYIYHKIKNPKLDHHYFVKDILWRNYALTSPNFEYELKNHVKINLDTRSILAKNIFFDNYELNEIAFLNKILRPGDTFLDIGANIGYFSLHAGQVLRNNGKIIAIEPTPDTFSKLKRNFELNNLTNVSTLNLGLSESEATLNFNVSNDGYEAWNTLGTLNIGTNTTTIPIHVISFDQLLVDQQLDIDKIKLIKIDVEGWEVPVLKGGIKSFAQMKDVIIMMEFADRNAQGAGFSCKEQFQLLKEIGYNWFEYDADTNSIKNVEIKENYTYDNLIAAKSISTIENRLSS